MKKSKRILLVLGIILIGTVLLFGYCYPFEGNSLFNRFNYAPYHKDHLHLSNDYQYKVTQYQKLDIFSSFVIIEFETQEDVSNLELIYAKDPNIQNIKNLYDSRPIHVFKEYIDYLPVDINCGCYTLYVINQYQSDGGYFYQVYIVRNKLYIFYASR